jgi:thioredoxin reductase (NADPH)
MRPRRYKASSIEFQCAGSFDSSTVIPTEVSRLNSSRNPRTLELSDGARTKAAAVGDCIWRALPSARRAQPTGLRGTRRLVLAPPIEARLCRREEIVLVGGGNLAGQAAVSLRDYAAKICLLVRGPSLVETISRYLIDRIEATPNIEVLKNTEVVALSGSPHGQLERIRWRHRVSNLGNHGERPVG